MVTEINPQFQLAIDFVVSTHRCIFLTGKAGTGKTTFLRHIKAQNVKEAAIVAPTGVAAINAGGTTIHSFFQLPLIPFIPENTEFVAEAGEAFHTKKSLLGQIRVQKDRRAVFQNLELLVIDEISMVRADILDQIDVILRHFRNNHSVPFGGVQVLMIGDMFQLPPVVKPGDWNLLSKYYLSPFFFHSKVLSAEKPVHIAFDKIYRQKDQSFVDLLNAVRENRLTPDLEKILDTRYDPYFEPEPTAGYITLTTHNIQADEINGRELEKVSGKSIVSKAEITGDFPPKMFPCEEDLAYKIGAQVMFIKNDPEKPSRFYNGKMGVVKHISEDVITIYCKGDSNDILLRTYKWANIKYITNDKTKAIEEEEIGSFTQFPLRLAWAITIHKSQGLTFEKAVIDAGEAFSAGQVYVALSRCTTLEGLVLKSKIKPGSLFTNKEISTFSETKLCNEALHSDLEKAKKDFQFQVLSGIFDFKNLIRLGSNLIATVSENIGSFNPDLLLYIKEIESQLVDLEKVAIKFKEKEFSPFIISGITPEAAPELLERIQKASVYFSTQVQLLIEKIKICPAETDNKTFSKDFDKNLNEILIRIHFSDFVFQNLHSEPFSIENFQKIKAKFVLPAFEFKSYSAGKNESQADTDKNHNALYKELKFWRDAKTEELNQPVYMVLSTNTLKDITKFLPQTESELLQISGFGKGKMKQFGKDILEIIGEYCEDHGLTSQMEVVLKNAEKKTATNIKKESVENTKVISYQYFKDGKTIAEIAALRNFSSTTIEGHLSHFVKSGEILINALVPENKVNAILPLVQSKLLFGAIKEQLGEDFSYFEIRIVANWWAKENGEPE